MTEHEVNDDTFCQSINNKRRSPNCVGSPQLDPCAQRREAARAKKAHFARLAASAVCATTVPLTHARTVRTQLTHALTRSPKDSSVCMCALLSLTNFKVAQLSNGVIVKATFALCMPDSITTTTRASVAKCRGV